MAEYRKPIPKTQRELSEDQHQAFDRERGNPNMLKLILMKMKQELILIDQLKLSFKGDNTKPFSIGIQDLDEAVFYYFENVISPFVYQNGERRNVPIIYGSPERWKSFQKDGYYRDKAGAVMLPIIVIKRDSISKDRTVTNKLDANMPNLYAAFQKSWDNPKNFYI